MLDNRMLSFLIGTIVGACCMGVWVAVAWGLVKAGSIVP